MRAISRILVPVDFSSYSADATERALDLAKHYHASVTLLHVCEPVYSSSHYAVVSPEPADTRSYNSERLRLFAEKHRFDAGIDLKTQVVTGAAAPCIVDVANETPFDLIVMGTHGRTGWKRLVLGSVAERVVRESPCPVFTVGIEESDSGVSELESIASA